MCDAKTVSLKVLASILGAHPALSGSDAFASDASSDARGTYIADAMEY